MKPGNEQEKALSNLPLLYELFVWFMQTYGDYDYELDTFVQPIDINVNLSDLEKENKELSFMRGISLWQFSPSIRFPYYLMVYNHILIYAYVDVSM